MKITVADLKTKTGEGKKGPWTLVIIKGEDGAEFTSFDKSLSDLTIGSVIEFEPEISVQDGKTKLNIKEWKLISKAERPVLEVKTGDQMSKEEWAERNKIERASIEAQTAVKALLSMPGLGVTIPMEMPAVVNALDWCIAKIVATMPAKPAPETKQPVKPVIKTPPPTTQQSSETLQSKSDTVKTETGSKTQEQSTPRVDKAWVKETLDIIRWKESTALSWMKAQLKVQVESKKLVEAIDALDDEQLKKFVDHIATMREVSGL